MCDPVGVDNVDSVTINNVVDSDRDSAIGLLKKWVR